ncbi:HAMP domain-containing sensor histidine kinase [Vibrio sp. CAU 1672]|uniref:sensor histidine kinase n=1 Tax=Vibrio sp. CAU 1672 TaxID=3032594 RepID=UPI0023D9ABEB|nr:HAMP domain-containing sensor histidine kinase [Vibrio sp. CAU 1672]MDF2154249.1 HAMP domain-containing sensor histidine kinase [Vibrio sp. CAU 1672]
MIPRLLTNTHSMTGRLALFFTFVSVVIGIFCFALITVSLLWSEDRVAERRIMIDRNEAIEYFQAHPGENQIQLDLLTTAYNNSSVVPEPFRHYLEGQKHFLDEVGDETDSRMIYMSTYFHQGVEHPIILVSLVDEVEITSEEFILAVALVLAVVAVLVVIFGSLLRRLSQSLIKPINTLQTQLDQHQGDPSQVFSVPPGSAQEFQTLAGELNKYRQEVSNLIKREQAFARYASHELRTPLTIMQGSGSLLAKGDNPPFQKRQIKRIQDATLQMSTMVDALLGLVRYERNQDDAPWRAISEQELYSIVRQSQAQADQKQLDVSVRIEGSPHTRATTAVLTILLGNLLRNAIAATPDGTIRVTMTNTAIRITDQGLGLASTPDANGHGLGLLIVEDLCHRYGWQFTIHNSPDSGCEAIIDLTSELP